jgi:excisionase family DNA binding protein
VDGAAPGVHGRRAGAVAGDFVTTGDVARFLGVEPSTVWRWCAAGKLPCVRIGSRYRIDPMAVRAIADGVPYRRA